MCETYTALRDRLLAFLACPKAGFEDLATEVFRFQFAHNLPYRSFCESIGIRPGVPPGWREIPPVPAEAFRGRVPLTCCPPEQCARVFLTSGTTGEVRGRHYLADTVLYESSVLRGWEQAGLPGDLPALFLARDPASTPESSLACMFGFLAGSAPADPWLLAENGEIRIARIEAAAAEGGPLLLFSTALALRHLFERLPRPCALPAGSWVFQTGGYKGLAAAYDPRALYADIEEHLGVPASRVINEYGMTELSTPSYTVGTGEPHRAPPWLRVRTINPETNRPNPPGEIGHLTFFDLANLNSVAAIRTRDLGVALNDHCFRLEGRDAAAEPRGCSRASDAHLRSS